MPLLRPQIIILFPAARPTRSHRDDKMARAVGAEYFSYQWGRTIPGRDNLLRRWLMPSLANASAARRRVPPSKAPAENMAATDPVNFVPSFRMLFTARLTGAQPV